MDQYLTYMQLLAQTGCYTLRVNENTLGFNEVPIIHISKLGMYKQSKQFFDIKSL